MPNTITMTSEYLPARRRGALVTLMFCDFTLGSAMGSYGVDLNCGWTKFMKDQLSTIASSNNLN